MNAWRRPAIIGPPKTARTEAESTTSREKSICSACAESLSRLLSHSSPSRDHVLFPCIMSIPSLAKIARMPFLMLVLYLTGRRTDMTPFNASGLRPSVGTALECINQLLTAGMRPGDRLQSAAGLDRAPRISKEATGSALKSIVPWAVKCPLAPSYTPVPETTFKFPLRT